MFFLLFSIKIYFILGQLVLLIAYKKENSVAIETFSYVRPYVVSGFRMGVLCSLFVMPVSRGDRTVVK